MSPVIQFGTRTLLEKLPAVSDLLSIDKEIGKPHSHHPLLFSSQAWSRRLELPWVIREIGPPSRLSILDVGSGNSALPICLARQGAHVVSTDPEIADHLPGLVETVRGALPRLPFRNESFDVVCCISVLEHLRSGLSANIGELCRLSRSKIVLTFDVMLGPHALYGLSKAEVRAFARAFGQRLVAPHDLLVPTGWEARSVGRHVGVCLASLDRPRQGWPSIRLTAWERFLACSARLVRDELWRGRRVRSRLRSLWESPEVGALLPRKR